VFDSLTEYQERLCPVRYLYVMFMCLIATVFCLIVILDNWPAPPPAQAADSIFTPPHKVWEVLHLNGQAEGLHHNTTIRRAKIYGKDCLLFISQYPGQVTIRCEGD